MSAEQLDSLLTDKLAKIPEEMTPERDLWTGIERAISHKNQQASSSVKTTAFVPMAWAASVFVAVLASWLSFAPLSSAPEQSGLVQHEASTEALVNFMDENFNQQKQAMLVSFGQPNLSTLPPAMQDELTKLADARKAIAKALLTDKDNVELLNLLDFTQQQELKLLAQLYRQYQVI